MALPCVSLRIVLLPVPGVAAHLVEGARSRPAENSASFVGVGPELGQVAVAARAELVLHGNAVAALEGFDYLHHAVRSASAEVEDLRSLGLGGVFNGLDVTHGQIDHMDVVAAAGAVGRGIVVAEDSEMVATAHGHLSHIGHEVVRNALRIFAHAAGSVRTYGVEVAEEHHGELGIGLGGVFKDLLHHGLSPAVGIGAGAARHGLDVRIRVLLAVHGGRRREHDVMHPARLHAFQKGESGVDVVAVVLNWLADGFAHSLEAREVDDAVDAVLAEDLEQVFLDAHVDFVGGNFLSRHFLYTSNSFRRAVAIVVRNDDIVPGIQQFYCRMRTDVPCAACEKYVHNMYLI